VIREYVAANRFTFKIAMQGKSADCSKAYGVRGYPTNYLVDTSGKILWRGVGFDEPSLLQAVARRLAR
jgi:hypothetical protein